MTFERVGVRAAVLGASGYVRDARRVQGATDKMGRGFGAVGGRVNFSTTQLLRFGAAMVGVQLGISVMSRAVIGLQSSTIGAAIAFESSFAGIRKTMDLTEDQFAELAQANRDLSKEIPITANELNRIGELAGQLGIDGVKNVVAFEQTIAQLALTTDLTQEGAALAFAQIANVIGLPQSEIGNLASAVVGLGNTFPTVESQIVALMQRLSGAAKLAGITAGQLTGIATAFASVGAPAEAAGSAAQKVLFAMTKAAIEGGEKLELFAAVAGTTIEEFARLIREEAAEAFTLFVEGLGIQGEDAIRVLDTLGLADIRVAREFLKLAGAGDLLSRAIKQGTRDFNENIAANEEAAKRFETTASKIQLLRNRLADILLTAGDVVKDGLDPLIEATLEWLDTNGEQFAKDLAGAIDTAGDAAQRLVGALDALAGFGPIRLAIEVPTATLLAGAAIAFATGHPFLAAALLVGAGISLTGAERELPAGLEGAIGSVVEFGKTRAPTLADVGFIEEIAGRGLTDEELVGLFALSRATLIPAADLATMIRSQQAVGLMGTARFREAPGAPTFASLLEVFEGIPGTFAALGEDRLRAILGLLPEATAKAVSDAVEAATDEEEEGPAPDLSRFFEGETKAVKLDLDALRRDAERTTDRLLREQVDSITLFGDLLTTALRRQAEQELDAVLDGIDERRRARRDEHDDRIAFIDKQRDALLAAIRVETDAQVAALDAQLGRIQEDRFAEDLAQLERERALAFDAKDRDRIDGEIVELKRRRRERDIRDEIRDVQDAGRDREDQARDDAATLLAIAREAFDADIELLDLEAEAARDTFADITDDFALQSEARRKIMAEELEEIERLLTKFVPEFATFGKSFGESFLGGFDTAIGDVVAALVAQVPGSTAAGVAAAERAGTIAERQQLGKDLKAAGAPGPVIQSIREFLADTFGVIAEFPHGGRVGPQGQRIPIMVEPGEIILNPAQQAMMGARTVIEAGAFEGMFNGASFNGSPEANARAARREFSELMADELGRGAFINGAGN